MPEELPDLPVLSCPLPPAGGIVYATLYRDAQATGEGPEALRFKLADPNNPAWDGTYRLVRVEPEVSEPDGQPERR